MVTLDSSHFTGAAAFVCRLKNGAKLKENREQKIHRVKSTRNAAACTEIKGAQVDSDQGCCPGFVVKKYKI